MQEGNMIYYESQKLKEYENNYVTHDLELVVIVHTLKVWRHYVMGRKFEIQSNHPILKYLFDQPNLNSWQVRWLEFLCEFEFDIKHVNRKENKVENILSRKFHVVAINTCETNLKDKILIAMTKDEFPI